MSVKELLEMEVKLLEMEVEYIISGDGRDLTIDFINNVLDKIATARNKELITETKHTELSWKLQNSRIKNIKIIDWDRLNKLDTFFWD